MLCGLIMAGGMGNKFWPLSSEDKPKQFVGLVSEESMLQIAVNRIRPIIPIERIFVSTTAKYFEIVKEQIPDLPDKNIILEPEVKGTAASIALSAMIIKKYYKNANLMISYCNYVVENEDVFRKMVEKYNKVLTVLRDSIVTFGVKPSRVETGYGYMLAKTNGKHKSNSSTFYRVERFEDKPTLEATEKFVQSGNYLWNAGVFICSLEKILEKINRYLPKTYGALKGLDILDKDKISTYIGTHYKLTDSTSIEDAVISRDNDIYVVPVDIGWDEVGTWGSLERFRNKDHYGNISIGNSNKVNGFNNLVIAAKSSIVVDGLSDIYVIEKNGQIVVGKKDLINNLQNIG